MESLSSFLSPPPPLKPHRTHPISRPFNFKPIKNRNRSHIPSNSVSSKQQQSNDSKRLSSKSSVSSKTSHKPTLSLPIFMAVFSSPLPSIALEISDPIQKSLEKINYESVLLSINEFSNKFPFFIASEISDPLENSSEKINVESIVLSIDDFFNRNPFLVAGVSFIYLVVVPLVQEYLKKYKYISAINAFKKLRDEPNVQLLDIRDEKNLAFLNSPNLRMLSKEAVQVEYSEGDDKEDEFVKKALAKFDDPGSTVLCILDNFGGNSMKVAELLFKNGFKEAYAIKGGARGPKGWQDIQETLLPPSVHIYPKKKRKSSQKLELNGADSKSNIATGS